MTTRKMNTIISTVPQIEPVSNLARDHRTVFGKLERGPVILANRSQPQAVLVSVDQWDEIARELEELRYFKLCNWIIQDLNQNPEHEQNVSGEELVELMVAA